MTKPLALLAAAVALPAAARAESPTTAPSTRPALSMTGSFQPGGPGRWDYVSIDPADHLLYVTRSTHTQVIDPSTKKVAADIPGGEGLHGVAVAHDLNRGFISDGRAAQILIFNLKTNQMLGKVAAADDADGIIYDPGTKLVLTACGDAHAMLVLDATADPATAKATSVDLGGKPEFLAADGKGRAFVCMEEQNQIAVVDLKAMKVTDRWSCGGGQEPAGLALDPAAGRLFVGCHNKKLIVMNAADGTIVDELPIGQGNDAVALDPSTSTAYASCGDGTLTVVAPSAGGHYAVSQTVPTQLGARTVALDPGTGDLYLPTAEYGERQPGHRWPPVVPGTFRILTVAPAAK